MDHERKELLAQKKAQLKAKQQREEIQQYKDRLTKSIEDFSQKYGTQMKRKRSNLENSSQNSISRSRGNCRFKKLARTHTKMFTCAF